MTYLQHSHPDFKSYIESWSFTLTTHCWLALSWADQPAFNLTNLPRGLQQFSPLSRFQSSDQNFSARQHPNTLSCLPTIQYSISVSQHSISSPTEYWATALQHSRLHPIVMLSFYISVLQPSSPSSDTESLQTDSNHKTQLPCRPDHSTISPALSALGSTNFRNMRLIDFL